jgi:hypothetical protein
MYYVAACCQGKFRVIQDTKVESPENKKGGQR